MDDLLWLFSPPFSSVITVPSLWKLPGHVAHPLGKGLRPQKWLTGLREADQNPLPGTGDWEQERARGRVGAGPGTREP